MTKATNQWAHFYTRQEDRQLMFPSEPLIRMMKGRYIPGLDRQYEGKRALDVGFGHGNNILFLAGLGLQVAGVEIHQEICDTVRGRLAGLGVDADLRAGNNREIPFDDGTFDFLISWDALHYETSLESYRAALAEFARVLKPGGRLLLSTVHPRHSILKGSRIVGPHLHQITREDDFRCSEIFFCAESEKYLSAYLSEQFRDVSVGHVESMLFTENVATFVATGVK